ncbi:hypothetical protein Fot_18486 [Forsythia ovata]|uniref:Uncharacterized protein n=1 Tax=Forsythia ovata TaxID=205694 RepID=A0ABD1VL27_9LAMI
MLSNPSTAIVVYQEMPRILIPNSEHCLGECEPVNVVMSNQPGQSAKSCPKDCAVLDSNFWQLVENAYHNRIKPGRNNSNEAFAKMLVHYVEGATPSLGKP